MKRAPVCLLLAALASCTTTQNSLYQSVAPEMRGERAISSAIELVQEVDLETAFLGVFFSKEVYRDGEAQNVLFTVRPRTFPGGKPALRITDYSLRETSSLSVEQARRFLEAIEQYLAKETGSVTPSEMISYELYSGTLDMSKGNEGYRPFQDLTFMAICSVTSGGKKFTTVFPYTVTSLGGGQATGYLNYNLTDSQVQKLRDAITAALAKATPIITPLPRTAPGR